MTLLPLASVGRADVARVGGKAGPLGELINLGFPVPAGFVLPVGIDADDDELGAALASLGGPVAVRSSGASEDGSVRSFAGQYETVLGVVGLDDVRAAIARCRASAGDARVAAYGAGDRGLAVVVQRMVAARAAGVAFTRDPVTGEDRTAISAVPGLGDRLVSGESTADEWVVDGAPRSLSSPHGAVNAGDVAEIAALARRIEAALGGPQDVEWAIDERGVQVLQARPMTALPEPVRWEAPVRGGWLRNFRFGEYLSEPVTPLFGSWLVDRVERRLMDQCAEVCGPRFEPPFHVIVNGWYFHSPLGSSSSLAMLGMLRRPRFALGMICLERFPALTVRLFVDPLRRHWEDELRPRFTAEVARAAERLPLLDFAGTIALVDALADLSGEVLFSIAMVGGSAWKLEGVLARFYRRHLDGVLPGGHQELLCGVCPEARVAAPHAVASIDWYRPTLGEMAAISAPIPAAPERHEPAAARCRAALSGRRARRFDALLALCRQYAAIREQQVPMLTLAWPVLRRALRQLGAELASRGLLEAADDVFFLERSELSSTEDLRGAVDRRRGQWRRDARLAPPLMVGQLPAFMQSMLADTVESMRTVATGDGIAGMPASPGIAVGRVRVVHGPDEFETLEPGEILVCPLTTPAWTPLLARAAAVVTDGGTIAAHASLVAREFGIPAVVATGDATRRLRDGERVRVDGGAGRVTAI